jgi:hypothetical protein
MLSKIKRTFIISVSLTSLMTLFAVPALAANAVPAKVNNNITAGICTGVDQGSTGVNLTLNPTDNQDVANCTTDTKSGNTLGTIISEVINIMSILVGVICVIMIIVGGFKYVTSGGESNSVSGAKNTIIYAIVGLVIVALAQVIVHFVLSRLSNGLSTT